MISVQNHRLQLSGNRFLVLVFILIAACSPKVVKQKNATQPEEKHMPNPTVEKVKEVHVSLLLPFNLKKTNSFTKEDVSRADLAIEFYQGFKLGIDSVLANGVNIDLQVLDSKSAQESINTILTRKEIQHADLVIGPVFPENIEELNKFGNYFVSPLAATMPDEFKNPHLISLIPNIELHAKKMIHYVSKKYKLDQTIVVLINPKTVESNQLTSYLKKELDAKYTNINVQEFANVNQLETKFQINKQYVVLIATSDKALVSTSIDKLSKIKTRLKYPIDVIGHPNWIKQNFNIAQLQILNTVLTTSYFVNYKRAMVNDFVKKFRALYSFEPSEFAFKGFDTGYYFANLVAKYGKNYVNHLTKEKYIGLQNAFTFYKDENLGFINDHIQLVKYNNKSLNLIE